MFWTFAYDFEFYIYMFCFYVVYPYIPYYIFHAVLYSANTEASSKVNATRLQPPFVTDYAVGTFCFYLGLFWKYFLKDFGFKALFSSNEIEFSIY